MDIEGPVWTRSATAIHSLYTCRLSAFMNTGVSTWLNVSLPLPGPLPGPLIDFLPLGWTQSAPNKSSWDVTGSQWLYTTSCLCRLPSHRLSTTACSTRDQAACITYGCCNQPRQYWDYLTIPSNPEVLFLIFSKLPESGKSPAYHLWRPKARWTWSNSGHAPWAYFKHLRLNSLYITWTLAVIFISYETWYTIGTCLAVKSKHNEPAIAKQIVQGVLVFIRIHAVIRSSAILR